MFKYVKFAAPYSLLFFTLLFNFALIKCSDVCEFNGLVPYSDQWEDEFSILLEDEQTPGYLLMTRVIGKIAVTNSKMLKSASCKISNYVASLVQYYEKNKDVIRVKHKNVADLLDYIKKKLDNSLVAKEKGV